MRDAFIAEFSLLARSNPRLMLVVGDLGFSVIEPFAREFPGRFINAGVAEQNMVGLAAGLASEGFHVFVYSIANFPTFRCAEQIRNDVAYHRLPVTIVAIGGGVAYGNLGYSHHAVQDYALMRVLPGMTIAAPGDSLEVRACLRYLVAQPGPSYLRLAKAGEATVHSRVHAVDSGKWIPVHPGSQPRKTLLTTGNTLALAAAWVADGGPYAGYALHSLPLWGMGAKAEQCIQAVAWEQVVTVEDHLRDAGFGSWFAESLSECSKRPEVKVRGLDPSVCDMVADQGALLNAALGAP